MVFHQNVIEYSITLKLGKIMPESPDVKPVAEPEEDILNLIYPDGTSEEVTLPAGTFAFLEAQAEKEGEPFDEAFILKVIREGINRLIEKDKREAE